MSAFSSPNPERSHGGHRTIRATFIATVLVPIASLLVIWGLLVAGVLGRAHRDLGGIFWVAGVGLVIIVISVALMGLFTQRLAADIGGLEVTAEHLADEELPQLVEKLRRGEPVASGEAQPATRAVTAEAANAEAAMASLARSAAAVAAAEASLRKGVGQVFVSLARRNQSLLQRQLRLIDALEQKASDPATLADLFPLDHLTTRMRRHAEGLIILAGAAPGRSWSEPVPVIDVVRGAVAEIEDYKRVSVLTRSEDAVAGQAVADMIHLLAELIENATLSSPPGTRVEVRTERVANGFAIEVDDQGLGIEAGQLAAINAQLANPPGFDLANADQLGLFVVGKLAARHGVQVALRPSSYGGTTAVVLMPDRLVMPPNVAGAVTAPAAGQTPGRGRELDPRAPDAPALPGRHSAPPLPVRGASPAPAGHPSVAAGTAPSGAGFPLGPPGPSAGSAGPGSLSTRSSDSFPPAPRPGSSGPGPAAAGPASPPTAGSAPPAAAPLPTRPGGAKAAGAQGPPADGARAEGAQPGASTYRGLPRRVRQASLNPHLRQSPPEPDRAAPAGQPAPADARTPEQARDLVSSLQRGWQRGRAPEPAAAQATDGTASATSDEQDGRRDADVPQAGEA